MHVTFVRAEWVKALRSGAYKQGVWTLRYEQKGTAPVFSVLGVLCEVARAYGVLPPNSPMMVGYFHNSIIYTTGVPEVVRQWIQLSSPDGQFRLSDGSSQSLAFLNDCRVPFDVLAAIIESEPEGLFVASSEKEE